MAHLLLATYKPPAPPVVQTFGANGGAQFFTVPAGLTGGTITVDMAGAAGGTYSTASGGLGGRVQCVLPATPGDTWQINVGVIGIMSANFAYATSFPGGGGYGNASNGGGGGGESDIRVGGTALANRKVVAGGGGGAGNGSSSGPQVGGAGGGTTAGNGGGLGYKGFGATPTAKGLNGPNAQQDAVQNNGGKGPNFGSNQGGGAGGGYWGGGGGGCEASVADGGGGGGGGSSYADPAATAVVHTQGYQANSGYVTLTYSVSTFVPSSLGTVLAWWDASALALNDGNLVSSWPDLSGNANNLVSTTQPTFRTAIFGTKPGVRSAGGSYLSVTSFLSGLANVTVAVVFQTTTGQTNKYFMSATSVNDGSNGFDAHFTSSTVIGSYLRTNLQAAAELTQTITYGDGTALVMLCSFQQGDTTGEHALNVAKGSANESTRVTLDKTNGATVFAPSNFTLFGLDNNLSSFGAAVDIAEVIVYGSALTLAQRTTLRAYLSTKWGALPAYSTLYDSEAFSTTENPLSTTDTRGLTWAPYGAAVFDSSAVGGGMARCKTGPLAWGGNGDICTVDEGQANGQLQVTLANPLASQGAGIAFRVGPYGAVNGYLALLVMNSFSNRVFFYVQKYVGSSLIGVYSGSTDVLSSSLRRRLVVQMNGTAVTVQCTTSDGLTVLDSTSFTDSSFSTNTRHGICGYGGGTSVFTIDNWEFDV